MLDAAGLAPTSSTLGGETAAPTLPLAIQVKAITRVDDGPAVTAPPAPPLDGGAGRSQSRRRRQCQAPRRRRQRRPRVVYSREGEEGPEGGGAEEAARDTEGPDEVSRGGGKEADRSGAGAEARQGMWWLS